MSAENSYTQPPPSWYRGFIQGKTRIMMAWIFSFILIFSAREFPSMEGILICFLGATLRFWASGYLRKDNKISAGGPYGYTRNPLYLGTYIMAIGTVVAIQNLLLILLVSVIFAAVYHYIILDEETKLTHIFGEPYKKYMQTVPRFFPRLLPTSREKLLEINPDASLLKFSWETAMKKNKAYEAYAAFAALMVFIAVIAYCWKTWG